MNVQKKDTGHPEESKDEDSVLERVAKTIAPPSREVSDAELIDPGANSPVPQPVDPAKSRSAPVERKRDDDSGKRHDK